MPIKLLRRVIDIPSHLEKFKVAAIFANKHRAAIDAGAAKIAATKSSDPKIQKLIDFAKKHGPPLPAPASVHPVNRFL